MFLESSLAPSRRGSATSAPTSAAPIVYPPMTTAGSLLQILLPIPLGMTGELTLLPLIRSIRISSTLPSECIRIAGTLIMAPSSNLPTKATHGRPMISPSKLEETCRGVDWASASRSIPTTTTFSTSGLVQVMAYGSPPMQVFPGPRSVRSPIAEHIYPIHPVSSYV